MKDIRKRLGYNVNRLRQKKGLSQSKLAEMVEISSTFMMHIEHGTRGASLETVELLAKALEVDIPVLFLRPRERTDDPDENTRARSALESQLTARLSETIRQCIDDYAGELS